MSITLRTPAVPQATQEGRPEPRRRRSATILSFTAHPETCPLTLDDGIALAALATIKAIDVEADCDAIRRARKAQIARAGGMAMRVARRHGIAMEEMQDFALGRWSAVAARVGAAEGIIDGR